MQKLKLQYFDRRLGTADSSEKTLMLGKIEDRRRRGCQRIQSLDCIADAKDINGQPSGDDKGQRTLACCSPWGHRESDVPGQPHNNSSSSHQGPQYWGFRFSISPSNEHSDCFPLGWTVRISLQSKGLSRIFSNTTV